MGSQWEGNEADGSVDDAPNGIAASIAAALVVLALAAVLPAFVKVVWIVGSWSWDLIG